jgi:hypothetical protein
VNFFGRAAIILWKSVKIGSASVLSEPQLDRAVGAATYALIVASVSQQIIQQITMTNACYRRRQTSNVARAQYLYGVMRSGRELTDISIEGLY